MKAMGRWYAILRVGVMALAVASPTMAALDDAPTSISYRGICVMDQTCTEDGACGGTPVLGELLLLLDEHGAQMGRDEADLSPVDHYPTLEDALPLPELEGFRRTFLVDHPPEGRSRRFAVHVHLIDPDSGASMLRPQYFVMTCLNVPA